MSEALGAVVAGHICLDVIPDLSGNEPGDFARRFVPGQLLDVGPAALATGGPVSNTGLALFKLGVPTQLMGKIADDLFGQAIRQLVAALDPALARGMVVDTRSHTSYSVIVNWPGVDRIFMHSPGANDTFCADDVRYDVVASAPLFHFGYPPLMRRMYEDGGIELAELLARARATGATVSLDMALPDPSSDAGRADWRTILTRALPFVDVFLPSMQEILYMLRRETYEELSARVGGLNANVSAELPGDVAGELLAMGARVVGLKLGDRGFYLRTAGQAALEGMGRARPRDVGVWANVELWSPCFKVDVVGTTGSGDATIAGFLSAMLRGMGPEDAVTAAVAVGACNVEAADALSGIRSWEETWERVKRGWEKRGRREGKKG